MLDLRTARAPGKASRPPRIGLAVAGGGPIGGIYEVGALRALDEAIDGLDMNALDVYVGVSSGAFVAAALANRLDTADMCRAFITGDSDQFRFAPEAFVRPALFEYLRRAAGVPRLVLEWLVDAARHPLQLRLSDQLMRLGGMLPTGLFDNEAIERFLREVFTSHGRSNDFRTLARKLYVVAVELDSGRAVHFGAPGHDHVPISRAIEASAALPGVYPPVKIDGTYYVDGALRHTLHASVALDAGADLLFAINPLVPIDAAHAHTLGKAASASLVDGGLPAVMSQTFRTLLQSRMQAGLPRYEREYAHADLVLLQPDRDDADMFFTNVFSFAHRERLAENAYRTTRADLRRDAARLAPLLARHGLRLREDVLADDSRTLLSGLRDKPARRTPATTSLHRALDDLDRALAPDRARAAKRPGRKARRPEPAA
ncbi:patatin-like phospholipase family protein [Dokdonella sp. MW10]|uniref:patatin-like phospholipase family protein n=1 Tax=Dokdonella sp. MW10 TaxID=2992926 RepID=UPI003F7FF293